jgi:hypothetical protein
MILLDHDRKLPMAREISNQNSPFTIHSLEAGEAMMKEISAQMNALRATKKTNIKRHTDWRKLTEEPAPMHRPENDMMGLSILSMLLQCLFGLPVFAGLGETAKGLLQFGIMGAVDEENPTLSHVKRLNKTLNDTQFNKAMNKNADQIQQMEMVKAITALLIAHMGGHTEEESTSGGSSDDGLIPDVLRHPTVARFKQNRHSMSCVRTLFQRQAEAVAPRLKTQSCALVM